jgi:GDP-L-fucose synthase
MKNDSRIYVAGHTGMVGSALWRRLEASGHTALLGRTMEELDLTRQADVEAFFEQELPEYVFLAAAKVGGIHANDTQRADFIHINLQIQSNVIGAAWQYGVKKLLFLGSSCIYPKMAPQPMREEYLLTSALEPTNEPYAIAKIAGLKLCESFRRQYGADFISAMPTNLYGINDNFNLSSSHVLPALIRKFHLARLFMVGDLDGIRRDLNHARHRTSSPIVGTADESDLRALLAHHGITDHSVEIWGSGTPRREFLNVDDCAAACVFLMAQYSDGLHVNVGCGEDLTIRDLAELIAEVVGYGGEMIFNTAQPDGTPKKLLDISRITAMGWKPQVGLMDGIRSLYDWYRAS